MLNLMPAMGGREVTQRRKDAKGCASARTHRLGETLLVGICFFFAPTRFCVTSQYDHDINEHARGINKKLGKDVLVTVPMRRDRLDGALAPASPKKGVEP